MKLSSLFITGSFLTSLTFGIPLYDLGKTLETTSYSPDETFLINEFSNQLTQIDQFNSTNSTKCEKCIKRLNLGKSIALTRPNLIYPIFTKWCIDNEILKDSTTCKLTYGRNTVHNASEGTNFANLLTLMDPNSYDGQLFCHYQQDKKCPLPKTPEIDMSSYWPEKQSKHFKAPEPSNETYNVLHISDFHIELDYQIGTEGNCTQNMCCTTHNDNKDIKPEGWSYTMNLTESQANNLSFTPAWYDSNGDLQYDEPIDVFSNDSIWQPASTWGQYKCDSPEVLINSSLKSIAKYQNKLGLDFKFSIFTGDLVDHDEDNHLNYEKNIKSEEIIFRDIKSTLKDIPVYPVLGNHDTFPYAQMAQEKSGFANLFNWNAELMGDLWEDYNWINSSTARYVRKHYSGFAVETSTNLKVIALNSNAYYASNLYNYWNATDIDSFGQFQFLIDELIESESKDQRVWIIAHIPFIQEALPIPAEVFQQILKRFSPYTIAGIFFGHTHEDQFNILYDGEVTNKTEDNAVNIAWISQAVTPLFQNNPSWRYYTIDSKTHSVMNSYNYYFKLNETWYEGSSEPNWEFEYSAREAYSNVVPNWPDSSPLNATFWHKVAHAIHESDEVAQTYNNYKRRFSPFVEQCIGTNDCDGSFCFLSSFTLKDYEACMKAFDEPKFQ
ncbi:sphingomyelin phosphodiesterase [Wickerhamomyces ciferrii]|uniref:Sphingomyelin phosphodiesterase n=1 Tax=Wickerhamomyces ciferrii (strain ATCC 14091 / BCRC 22168 / CBS 111 / JCM 3599 / NBRC 0793 / NRRL Y-1031 F-60-10) TaxID=1206466 RepID=K0KQL7_WICCF|nr:sphingomyelin phosphodiesterase [Wickerhamomyces ciferrii]CCH43649.1 sphingomyelin phosphodiesterase [Wickerhamomyces ciferrii]